MNVQSINLDAICAVATQKWLCVQGRTLSLRQRYFVWVPCMGKNPRKIIFNSVGILPMKKLYTVVNDTNLVDIRFCNNTARLWSMVRAGTDHPVVRWNWTTSWRLKIQSKKTQFLIILWRPDPKRMPLFLSHNRYLFTVIYYLTKFAINYYIC